jgi:hypothetical protein
MNNGFANSQSAIGPVPLVEPFDSAHHYIWAQTPTIETHMFDCSIGCDQEWEHVESLDASGIHELDVGASSALH